jgi:hypothetical protein
MNYEAIFFYYYSDFLLPQVKKQSKTSVFEAGESEA